VCVCGCLSGVQEVMGKEEEEKDGLPGKRLPFIPFPSEPRGRLSHDELEISASWPEPIPSASHASSDPASAGQCDATVQLIERETRPGRWAGRPPPWPADASLDQASSRAALLG
jgi:hypothetical protein